MAKQSSIPSDILQYVPCKCCRVKNDRGIYRVYRYHSVKRDDGRWGSDFGTLIGKIIPGKGFVANKNYDKEMNTEDEKPRQINMLVHPTGVTDVSYGEYGLLIQLSKDILERLEKHFTVERSAQIYSYALVLCVNDFVYIDQIEKIYYETVLPLAFYGYTFKMGYTALSNLLHDLGACGGPINDFEQSLIDSCSHTVAIDGHVIRSCSNNNQLAELGYKASLIKSSQVNLLIAYDAENDTPIMYRTFRGSSPDKKSVIAFLESHSFVNTKFMVDRGFYSAKIIKLMSSDGNTYIIPVPSNNRDYKRIKKSLKFTSGEFVYRAGERDSARVVYYEEKIDENTRMIVYRDEDENNSVRKSYQIAIANGVTNYTPEGYEKYKETWGVYYLQTNTTESAAEVYADYKKRWSIETYNNYIKNDAHFCHLKHQDYYAEHGFDFIMLITGLIQTRLNAAVKSLKKSNISTHDISIAARYLRMVFEHGEWRLRNEMKKDLELLNKLGFTPLEKITPSNNIF